jgi:acyl-CoA dehydrogenase
MWPWSNDELEMLRATARRFFAEHVTPHEKRWDARLR